MSELPPDDEPSKSSGSDKRRRTEILPVRATLSEKQQFNAMASARNQSFGDLVRTTLLKLPPAPARRQPHPDREALVKLLAELGKIGSNINQLAKRANEGRFNQDSIDDACRELMEYRTLVMQALGYERRQPNQPDDEPE